VVKGLLNEGSKKQIMTFYFFTPFQVLFTSKQHAAFLWPSRFSAESSHSDPMLFHVFQPSCRRQTANAFRQL